MFRRVKKISVKHPTGNHSPMHEAMEYVTRSPVTEPTIMHEDERHTATRSPTDRVENLLQSHVDNVRCKWKLRKNDSGKPVDSKESAPNLEDDKDDETTEEDYEGS